MKQTYAIQTSDLILLTWSFVLSSNQYRQHSQYNDYDISWKIWVSNLGRNKRTISSPKHPDQLQHPPSLQLNENLSFFFGSKVASEDSLTTHIRIEPSLKISGANLHSTCFLPWHILGQLYSTFTSYLCTYLSIGHILSGLIKEPFYTSLTCYMHTMNHLFNLH